MTTNIHKYEEIVSFIYMCIHFVAYYIIIAP